MKRDKSQIKTEDGLKEIPLKEFQQRTLQQSAKKISKRFSGKITERKLERVHCLRF